MQRPSKKERRSFKRKARQRQEHKVRQKIERAMRTDGSLQRLTMAQACLRRPETAVLILEAIKRAELGGPIDNYKILRELVARVLESGGLDLTGVMLKFSFGPGCGACNHVHDEGDPCGWPGCGPHIFRPGNILGITAASSLETIQAAATAAGVTPDLTKPF